MAKSHLTINFRVPTTSMSRIQDVMVELKKVIDDHRGEEFFATIAGPIPAINEEAKTNGKRKDEDPGSDERLDGRGEHPGDGDADAAGNDKPKRGRGRPRKSDAEEAGPSSRKRERDAEDDGGTEGTDGNEPKRTRKSSDEGPGQGEGRSGGSGGSGSSERGNRKAPRLEDEEEDDAVDDWGDDTSDEEEEMSEEEAAKATTAWPDHLTPKNVDKATISKLLGEHYNATGGKDRTLTFDIMEDVAGTRKLGDVEEDDYRKLAKALLKDTARYKHGVKKAK